MKQKTRQRLTRVGSFLLAGALLWLALRGVDFERVLEDLAQANYWWMVPIVVAMLVSHWLRAWRWTFLIDELETPGSRRVTIGGAFAALMIGYLANYVAPRAGELVRTANVSRRYKQPFTGVLGTVITERVLDLITLFLAFLSLPFVFSGRLGEIRDLLTAPLDRLPSLSLLWTSVVVLGLAAVVFGLWRWLRAGRGARIRRLLQSLRHGLVSVASTPKRLELVLSTIGMWILYAVVAYLPFVMFGYHTDPGVGFWGAWGIMLLGAIGVVIPAPGGFGSYHYITIQSLVLLFAFSQDAAASYAILTHTGQLLIYVVTGAISVLAMGFSAKPPVPQPAVENS